MLRRNVVNHTFTTEIRVFINNGNKSYDCELQITSQSQFCIVMNLFLMFFQDLIGNTNSLLFIFS